MTRANFAAFMSRSRGLVDTLHLTPTEVIDLALRLAIEQSDKAGLDAASLHDRIGGLLAAHAVEGDNGGGHAD